MGGDPCCSARQLNTHITESREVRYPWHPWFGRCVVVYDRLINHGHAVCRCGLALEEERRRRPIEIPTWMFEPLACSRLRVMATPMVGCDALLELKALLQAAHRPDCGDVLQAQHRSLLTAGGADATISEPTPTLATHPVSAPIVAPIIADVLTRDPREDDPIARATAPRARRPKGRRRGSPGGA